MFLSPYSYTISVKSILLWLIFIFIVMHLFTIILIVLLPKPIDSCANSSHMVNLCRVVNSYIPLLSLPQMNELINFHMQSQWQARTLLDRIISHPNNTMDDGVYCIAYKDQSAHESERE